MSNHYQKLKVESYSLTVIAKSEAYWAERGVHDMFLNHAYIRNLKV